MSAPLRPRPYGAALSGEAELAAVAEVLRSGVLYRYHGSAVAAFEERFAGWLGGETLALAVNSGTSALQLALAACDLGPGAEVLVPTFGFVSAATAVRAAGAVPRFVGVDGSAALDLEQAEAAVTDRTAAVLAVHPYGAACDLDGVARLAARHGLRVVEDVAQACGASFRGRPLGRFGDAAAFSFQHFKLIATGEGGMVTTGDRALHDRASFLHDSAAVWTMPERAARVGTLATAPGNLRMSELEGAIGLCQLRRCDELIAGLRRLEAGAGELLADLGAGTPAALADPAGAAGSHLIVHLGEGSEPGRRAAALREHGVAAFPLLGPPGSNRHWAGDWHLVLAPCGIPTADPETLASDRRRLGDGLLIQVEPGLDAAGGEAWLERLAEGLGAGLPVAGERA